MSAWKDAVCERNREDTVFLYQPRSCYEIYRRMKRQNTRRFKEMKFFSCYTEKIKNRLL
jgi:hypothetical protein